MDPIEDPPHGPGDEDDEGPSTPWLPPDDRLWRHPSEVRANPPPAQRPPAVIMGGWLRSANARLWFVGATSGAIAALVCALVLLAAGAVDRPSPVVTVKPAATAAVTSTSPGGPPDATAILDSVEPAVVGLNWSSDSGNAWGSGVVVYSSGPACYLLSESSIFSGATASTPIQVESYWGEVANGHIVGTDPAAGIAVIKVDLCVRTGRYPAVGTANLGSVANIQTGQEIFSIGSPAIAASTNGSDFASGYLDDATSYLAPVNGQSNAMFSMLVADLSVDSSAYGGAIVDSSGDLIGITNQGSNQSAKSGLTYITPIDTAIPDVTAIIKNGQSVSHAWLGVLQVTDISAPGAQGLKVTAAIEVQSVASGSPAAKAGIADNDVITAVDGHTEYVSSVGAFLAWMALAKPGEVVDVDWLKNGQPHQAHITLGTEPAIATQS
jgi:putative serine protease PepD